jgi:Uma2 family endonuclease
MAVGMATETRPWTLAKLHRLPDDGNKYELVYGELFVTPAPRPSHEEIIAILVPLLNKYVERWRLGRPYTTRAVVRARESEVEPDIQIREIAPPTEDWSRLPVPMLVVEVTSSSTRRRDREKKRQYYIDIGVADYWIVDRETRSIQVVRPGTEDVVEYETVRWQPAAAQEPLAVDVQALFREALGEA